MPFGPFADFADCQSHMEGKYGTEGAKKVCGAMQARLGEKSDQGHAFDDLPKDAQMLWTESFAESLQKNDDKASAKVAWANVYRRWEKGANGQWMPFKILLDEIKFKSLQKQDRIIYGAASVAIKDTDGQLITEDALREAFNSYITRGHVLFYHQNIPVGEVLPLYKGSDGKELKSGVRGKELDIVVRMYKDTQIANEVWNEIEAGRLRAFSIGGQVIGEPVKVCEDVDCKSSYERIDKIDLHEISIVPNPANEASYFQVIKSKVETVDKAPYPWEECVADQRAAGADNPEAVCAAIKNRTVAHAKKWNLAKSDEEGAKLVRDWMKNPFSLYWVSKITALETLIVDEKTMAVNCPSFTSKALKIISGEEDTMVKVDLVELQSLKESLKKEILAELKKQDCAEGMVYDEKLGDCVEKKSEPKVEPMTETKVEEKKVETPSTTTSPAISELDALRVQVKELANTMDAVQDATKQIASLKESISNSPAVADAKLAALDEGAKVLFEPEKTPTEYVDIRSTSDRSESFASRLDRIAKEFSGQTADTKVKEPEKPKSELESLRSDVLSMTNSLKATMDEIKALKEKQEISQVRATVSEMAGLLKTYHNEVTGLKDSMSRVPKLTIQAPAEKRTVAVPEDSDRMFPEIVNVQGNSQGDFEKRMSKLVKEYGLTQ